MPRVSFKCNPLSFYHVTNRCINKDWFEMPLDQVWSIMQSELHFVKHAFDLEIYCFVLMNNHFHLLVRAPKGNLSEAMAYFLRQVALQIVKKQKRINHLWARRFHRSEIKDFHHFKNVYKYIYQNPIRAKVCKSVLNYKYSTIRGLLGFQHLLIPTTEDPILFDGDIQNVISWLDREILEDDLKDYRLALQKSRFALPTRKKKSNPLNNNLL